MATIQTFKGVVRLTKAQLNTLINTGSLSDGTTTITYDPQNTIYLTPQEQASTSDAGVILIATDQDVQTGTNTTKAVTPAQLKTAIIGIGNELSDTQQDVADNMTNISTLQGEVSTLVADNSTNKTDITNLNNTKANKDASGLSADNVVAWKNLITPTCFFYGINDRYDIAENYLNVPIQTIYANGVENSGDTLTISKAGTYFLEFSFLATTSSNNITLGLLRTPVGSGQSSTILGTTAWYNAGNTTLVANGIYPLEVGDTLSLQEFGEGNEIHNLKFTLFRISD